MSDRNALTSDEREMIGMALRYYAGGQHLMESRRVAFMELAERVSPLPVPCTDHACEVCGGTGEYPTGSGYTRAWVPHLVSSET